MELSNSLTKRLSTILATMSLVVFMSAAQKHQVGKSISKDLFGIFIEDLNYTADGGLYAEMVQNRSFEYSPSDVDLHEYHKRTMASIHGLGILKSGMQLLRCR